MSPDVPILYTSTNLWFSQWLSCYKDQVKGCQYGVIFDKCVTYLYQMFLHFDLARQKELKIDL